MPQFTDLGLILNDLAVAKWAIFCYEGNGSKMSLLVLAKLNIKLYE